jgi:hypothetical protein
MGNDVPAKLWLEPMLLLLLCTACPVVWAVGHPPLLCCQVQCFQLAIVKAQ